LKGSFLEPYLPAASGVTRKFDAADKDLAELGASWMISTKTVPGVPLHPAAAWSGVQLNLLPGATALPNTGGLFVERQVGRGRIVVSAIQLSERDFINWRSGFEGFFNSCLLRRQPRKYYPGHFGGATLNWADDDKKEHRLDASLNTNLYYFARDLGVATSYRHATSPDHPNQQLPKVSPSARGRTKDRINEPMTINPQPPGEYRPPDSQG